MAAVPLTDIEPLRPLLTAKPLGLFSDIDGTLSPVVDRPEDAKVTPRCRDLLRALIGEGVQVALITGRPLNVARSMVGLGGAAYAANHGLEFWVDGTSGIERGGVGDYFALVNQVNRQADDLARNGVTIELKGQGVAFHYRQASDTARAVARIEDVIRLAPAALDFQRIEGRKVIELRPDINVSKGTAALQLAGQMRLSAVICIGDDTTDIAMFDAVHGLARQAIAAMAVAVMSPEIHPDVLAAADYSVEGVDGVEWLLAEVTAAIRQTAG